MSDATARVLGSVSFACLIVLAVVAGPAGASAAEPPGAPGWRTPAGGYVGKTTEIVIIPGSSTASMTVLLNEVPVGTLECSAGVPVSFGRVAVRAGLSTFSVIAATAEGETRRWDLGVRRLEYAWPTCIIIDKSDFRLYWIRDDVLVKAYAIAHGKRRTPTPNAIWKVGRKEKTPPKGVYGPRKLRLFRRVTYRGRNGRRITRYKYTNYGIHGTNQPWVIGTMASHGCIRLLNSQISELWPQVPVGTPVQTRR